MMNFDFIGLGDAVYALKKQGVAIKAGHAAMSINALDEDGSIRVRLPISEIDGMSYVSLNDFNRAMEH